MQEKKEKKALKVDKKIEKGGKKEKKAAAAAEAAAAAAEPAKAPAAPRVLRKGTLGVFAKPLADDELAKKLLKIVGAGAKVRGPPGHGLRPRYSRAWLAPIAFTACFVEAVEGMMGVTDAGLPALFEQLTDVFGVGAFAPGGGRFNTFLRDYRALLPTASAFADAWDELARQAFVGGGAGPLDVASGNAGAGRGAGAKLQRDMTAQLEQGRRDELHRDMMRLPRLAGKGPACSSPMR